MISCIVSGSSVAASREESTRSQKRTLTCFCSPSMAAREVRIRSARCFGV